MGDKQGARVNLHARRSWEGAGGWDLGGSEVALPAQSVAFLENAMQQAWVLFGIDANDKEGSVHTTALQRV